MTVCACLAPPAAQVDPIARLPSHSVMPLNLPHDHHCCEGAEFELLLSSPDPTRCSPVQDQGHLHSPQQGQTSLLLPAPGLQPWGMDLGSCLGHDLTTPSSTDPQVPNQACGGLPHQAMPIQAGWPCLAPVRTRTSRPGSWVSRPSPTSDKASTSAANHLAASFESVPTPYGLSHTPTVTLRELQQEPGSRGSHARPGSAPLNATPSCAAWAQGQPGQVFPGKQEGEDVAMRELGWQPGQKQGLDDGPRAVQAGVVGYVHSNLGAGHDGEAW
ncbi:hypothetical protein V8C86DRAFT_3141806, partial [Haematococcus lacustris]